MGINQMCYLFNLYDKFKFVMSFVSIFRVDNEENNLVLVSLCWNPNSHILTVFPDFNSNNSAGYILPISTVKDSCFEYRFWIENLSNDSLKLTTDIDNVLY